VNLGCEARTSNITDELLSPPAGVNACRSRGKERFSIIDDGDNFWEKKTCSVCDGCS
jgi:hypothetical protein